MSIILYFPPFSVLSQSPTSLEQPPTRALDRRYPIEAVLCYFKPVANIEIVEHLLFLLIEWCPNKRLHINEIKTKDAIYWSSMQNFGLCFSNNHSRERMATIPVNRKHMHNVFRIAHYCIKLAVFLPHKPHSI